MSTSIIMHDFSFVEIKQVDLLCYTFSKFLEDVFEFNKNITVYNCYHRSNIHNNFCIFTQEKQGVSTHHNCDQTR